MPGRPNGKMENWGFHMAYNIHCMIDIFIIVNNVLLDSLDDTELAVYSIDILLNYTEWVYYL